MTRNSTLLPESESHDITVTWSVSRFLGKEGWGGGGGKKIDYTKTTVTISLLKDGHG